MARPRPVASVVVPSDLACVPNGHLPSSLLVSLGPGLGSLHHLAARSWLALQYTASEAGWPLTWTYGGLYRTLDQQISLFMQRWQSRPLASRPSVHYAGGLWWLRAGVARAAVPGTSNHGLGLAVDVALGAHPSLAEPVTPALSWLVEHADEFSYTWEDQTEAWHIRYVSGDQVPPATLAFEERFDLAAASERT